MDELLRLQRQLHLAIQAEEEVRKFVFDLAEVRLDFIIKSIAAPQSPASSVKAVAETDTVDDVEVDWLAPAVVEESGIGRSWVDGLRSPREHYLYVKDVLEGDWSHVLRLVGQTFLSDKQLKVLLPTLHRKRRVKDITAEAVTTEVRLVNRLLHWVASSGVTADEIRRYQDHLRIHGASQNVAANVGAAGAVISIVDALTELDPKAISGLYPGRLPPEVRSPIDVYRHLQRRNVVGSQQVTRSILLKNGRAVVFAADPDIAIIQPAEPARQYASAEQALRDWELVRRAPQERNSKVLQRAVGEVKTATDLQSLHERLALGGREGRSQARADRFLLMAILTREILEGEPGNRRRSPSLSNRDVNRFSDVFNLHFAWGYDDARASHAEHWEGFKARLADWCGI